MLPTTRLSPEKKVNPPPQPRKQGSDAASRAEIPRILIVEDEFLVAWHLQEMLRDLDLEASDIAGDPQGAIDRAIDFEPNILLMDINLGEGPDGIEVVRRIREHRDVAVIFITAYTDPTTLGRIRQVAPDAPVLAKPPGLRDLRAAISNIYPARKN